jgi:hypothetical protein
MTVGQEAEASAAVAGCPLVTREMMFAQVVPKGRAEGLLVQDILHIRLDEGERLLHFPRPQGWIEGLAAFTTYFFDWITAAKDVADGVRGDVQTPSFEVKGKSFPAIACSLTGFPNTLLYLR